MVEKTDEEIVIQVQKGDSQSFGLLMERYEQKLLRYASKFVYDGEDRKDLVQEVFIKAYTNIQSFDIKLKFSPWLYRIAHNEFINAIKKKSKDKIIFFDFDAIFPHPISAQTADGDINKQELRLMLDRSLDKLDSKYRETLVLYYLEEMDYKEISEILQVPVSTVGVRLRRGRTMLAKIIKKLDKQLDKQYGR